MCSNKNDRSWSVYSFQVSHLNGDPYGLTYGSESGEKNLISSFDNFHLVISTVHSLSYSVTHSLTRNFVWKK